MYKIYVPSRGVEDWQLLLADPVKHWKTGYSAKARQDSLPGEVGYLIAA